MSGPIRVEVLDGHVGLVELDRPPHNFFDVEMVEALADAVCGWDGDPTVRAVVLAASGRSFCAGADFSRGGTGDPELLYEAAARLCGAATPVIAAVHGAAIGGGLGVAMTASMRITCPEARLAANFVKLGIHHGFGLSVTLPELIGPSRAAQVLLTGRRYSGDAAVAIGMADLCVRADEVRPAAVALAREIATGAPLAIESINRTLRAGLADRVRAATSHEAAEQARLRQTADAAEGVRSVSERRPGDFTGR